MKKLLVFLFFTVVAMFFLFAGETEVYPVTVKWSVSVFSGKIEPLGEDPYRVEITTTGEGLASIKIPPLYMSPDYPPTEAGILENVFYTVDKKGNVELKYSVSKEEKEKNKDADMALESISGDIKKGKLDLKMKIKMKGVPFDVTIKFESV